jgi:glycosyltransferase involved in cell wall biosynthesis
MPKPSLCLNMIVKNEAARIERCLVSVLPYVKSVAVLDTGSTDDTIDTIKDVCLRLGVPVVVQNGAFINFSQARNEAFRVAKNARDVLPWFNFVLLMDADMELVVSDPSAFSALDANALSYDMMQKGGAVSYANRRIVNINAKDELYVGVTHEYVDVPAAGMIAGAMFVDWADGANRSEKYPRDAALLEKALASDPDNGRYRYYLANTYRDWARPIEAIAHYDQRLALGGWDEETHSSMMNRAACWRDRGNDDKFVTGMIEAYNFRPQRAEPLYDLARYYREKGNNAAAALFSSTGLEIPRPNDLLFVNDFVYSHGLRYEFSIAGFDNEATRPRAYQITNALALDPSCPHEYRWSARSNLFWYTEPLSKLCPSFSAKRLDFVPPHGYTALNPSVEINNGLITCNIRTVNYRINQQGQYTINGVVMHDGGPAIDTRNFIVYLDWNDLSVQNPAEVIWDRPAPAFAAVTGLEDIRLWRYCGNLHFSATVREQSAHGVCQIATGRLVHDVDPAYVQVRDYAIISDEVTYEKNWMPMPSAPYGHPPFMYRLDVVFVDGEKTKLPTPLHVGDISGSSQLVPFGYGLLAVTHEASVDPCTSKRTYWHRFALFDRDGRLQKLSRPFVFFARQIEFCSGLANYHGGKLLLSFGVRDEEAWIATVEDYEIHALLEAA